MIRVRILLKSSYSFEKNENDKGEAVVGIFVQSKICNRNKLTFASKSNFYTPGSLAFDNDFVVIIASVITASQTA